MEDSKSNIKHELNNLLNGIIGSAEIIRESEHLDEKKLKKFSGFILDSAIKASEITKKLK